MEYIYQFAKWFALIYCFSTYLALESTLLVHIHSHISSNKWVANKHTVPELVGVGGVPCTVACVFRQTTIRLNMFESAHIQ